MSNYLDGISRPMNRNTENLIPFFRESICLIYMFYRQCKRVIIDILTEIIVTKKLN